MPPVSPDQVFKFVREFGLSIAILLAGSWYLSTMLEAQQVERQDITLYVRAVVADDDDVLGDV